MLPYPCPTIGFWLVKPCPGSSKCVKKWRNYTWNGPVLLSNCPFVLGAAAEARGWAERSRQEQGETEEEPAWTDWVHSHAQSDKNLRETKCGGTDHTREEVHFFCKTLVPVRFLFPLFVIKQVHFDLSFIFQSGYMTWTKKVLSFSPCWLI